MGNQGLSVETKQVDLPEQYAEGHCPQAEAEREKRAKNSSMPKVNSSLQQIDSSLEFTSAWIDWLSFLSLLPWRQWPSAYSPADLPVWFPPERP